MARRRTQPVGIMPLPASGGILDIIVQGVVPCGPAMFNYTQLDGLPLRRTLTNKPGSLEAFEVTGDSMSDAGLHAGDQIICDCLREHRKGDIVVVRSDHNEYSCKRWTGSRLQGESEGVLTELAPDCQWDVLGVVISVCKDMPTMDNLMKELVRLRGEVEMLKGKVQG